NRFLDKVEDNAAIPIWSEKTQQEKGDSLTKGYMSELWDFTRISVTQNNLQGLKEGRLGAHYRRVYNSTPLPEDPS
ncbi:hypothetical protein Goshw_023566, partial [Gossypium schwendimanii]|nr:hypothetical protein [Gossypium schwendimanii]